MRHDRLIPSGESARARRALRPAQDHVRAAVLDPALDEALDPALAPQERQPQWGAIAAKQIAVIGALLALAYLLRDRLAMLDLAAIMAHLPRVSALQWGMALGATVVSFWALARYDRLIHQSLNTGVRPQAAGRAGAVAIALSQTLGFGLISGALARWRMVPGLSLLKASKVTAVVAGSFLLGWGLVTGPALLVLPSAWAGAQALGLALTAGGAVVLALGTRYGGRSFGPLTLPPPSVLLRITWLAAVDTLAAGMALYVLLPEALPLSFIALFPAFMLALGAGFVSGSPGGVGPFEVTLLATLPSTLQPEAILAAVLAWRLVYFALPAVVAAVALTRPAAQAMLPERAERGSRAPIAPPARELTPRLAALVEQAPRAETLLLRQGEHAVLLAGNARAGWMLGTAGRCLVGLLDPFGAQPAALVPALLPRLAEHAQSEGRVAALYKICARSAAAARALGWQVMPVAREAYLRPAQFSLECPARAGLRRKLRKAEKAGLTVTCADATLPLPEMEAISKAWVAAHGEERGFSMGRFAPDYVMGQRVYLAWHKGVLVGFASFHEGAQDWALDLMRPAPTAPDGTMQALITAALREANAYGIARLSLAALPPEQTQTRGLAALVWRSAHRSKRVAGLRQFKASFAPEWQTLYFAAQNRAALALAAVEIARAIRHPAALHRVSRKERPLKLPYAPLRAK